MGGAQHEHAHPRGITRSTRLPELARPRTETSAGALLYDAGAMGEPTGTWEQRCATLLRQLAETPRLAVAFSGGVDSAVLLHAAHATLGAGAVGVIADSPSLPRADLEEAREVAFAIGARLEVLVTEELEVEGYRQNAGDRCYWCRHTMFTGIESWARSAGFSALAYGEITDDLGDDRPGRRAAAEFGVIAPLTRAGFSKDDVRRYAREVALSVADKPAQACLASRIPVGVPVTLERLTRVEGAEAAVRALGFRVLRVRDHGERARLEVGADEWARARGCRESLLAALGEWGFLDLDLAIYAQPAGGSASGGAGSAVRPIGG